jgi:hypothetical protein
LIWKGNPTNSRYTNWDQPPGPEEGLCAVMNGEGKWIEIRCTDSKNWCYGCRGNVKDSTRTINTSYEFLRIETTGNAP